MRIERKNNAAIIDSLTGLGHRVRIRHFREATTVLNKQFETELRISQTGGCCRVDIELADGEVFTSYFRNHSKKQYNKNFAVHVALQRALKAMNKAHAIDEGESDFAIKWPEHLERQFKEQLANEN